MSGKDVRLTCNVQAYPPAISYWTKQGKAPSNGENDSKMTIGGSEEMLFNGPKYRIWEETVSQFEKVVHLTIKDWSANDEGYFACTATNSLGKADGKLQAYSELS